MTSGLDEQSPLEVDLQRADILIKEVLEINGIDPLVAVLTLSKCLVRILCHNGLSVEQGQSLSQLSVDCFKKIEKHLVSFRTGTIS